MPVRYRARRRPRRITRRRRLYRRKIMRRPMTKRRPIHTFKRTIVADAISVAPGGATGGLTWKLDDLDNYTEFTNLFDQYRLIAVKCEFRTGFTDNPITASTVFMPEMYSAIDRNDATAPANVAEIVQYETLKRKRLTSPMKRYFRLNTLQELTDSAVGVKFNQWIDTATPDVEHYGLKYIIDPINGADTYSVIPTYTLYFQCRSVI